MMLAVCASAQGSTESISILHSFGYHAGLDGGVAPNTLVKVKGNYYGTTAGGGSASLGALFKFDPASGDVTVLHAFCDGSTADDGQSPSSLILGSDGNLYGTTIWGGSTTTPGKQSGYGVLFEYEMAKGKVLVLHSFRDGSVAGDGEQPQSLTQGSDGNLYGVAMEGGSTNTNGALFEYNRATKVLSIVHSFGDGSVTSDGKYPKFIIQGQQGVLYGTTESGGSAGYGALFSYSTTAGFAIVHNFYDGSVSGDGKWPTALAQASNGTIYGVASYGGSNSEGVLYKYGASSGVAIVHGFTGSATDGMYPTALAFSSSGVLYGVTQLGGAANRGTIFSYTSSNGVSTVYSFQSAQVTDGSVPNAIIAGANGIMYGLTQYGGTLGTSTWYTGQGTVFTFNPTGTKTTIAHDFGGVTTDGIWPTTLVWGSDGNLYGGTECGGSSNSTSESGSGVVFALSGDTDAESVLYNLGTSAADGRDVSTILFGLNDELYATTEFGGAHSYGDMFSIDPASGDENILHQFNPELQTDAGSPDALVQTSDGEFYGGAQYGGVYDEAVFFDYALGSTDISDLRSFDNYDDIHLVVGADGNIYGVANQEGGYGVFFEYNRTSASFAVLQRFSSNEAYPSSLIQGADGNFYGTTFNGGTAGIGTLYEINMTTSELTILHSFSDGSVANDGYFPVAVVQGADKNLYGVTMAGGYKPTGVASSGDGVLFEYGATTGYALVHTFGDGSVAQDGAEPTAIVAGADGNIYGATENGGAAYEGTLFALGFARLKSLALNPASVIGGNQSNATVTLTGKAPIGGMTLSIQSSSADATLPAKTITIPAGSTSVQFKVGTLGVAAQTTAKIAVKYGSITKTATLTIKP
jgi:uncharacterized repeat protein (TIGR03803 family)